MEEKKESRIWLAILGIFLLIIAVVLLVVRGVFSLIFSFTTGGSWMLFVWFLLSILFFFAFLGVVAKIKFLSLLASGWFLTIYFIFSLFVIINLWWQVVPLEKAAEVKEVTKVEKAKEGVKEKEEVTKKVSKEACEKIVVEDGVITVPGEIGKLSRVEQWSVAGSTGRVGAHCGGELYMGIGGVTATYKVNIDNSGKYAFWIRTSDDALHPLGSRAVTITINEQKGSWTDTGESYPWKWFKISEFQLDKGENTVVILKNESTSAAFVMDEFILSKDPNYIPE